MECLSIQSSFIDHKLSLPKSGVLKVVFSVEKDCCRFIIKTFDDNVNFNKKKSKSTVTHLVKTFLMNFSVTYVFLLKLKVYGQEIQEISFDENMLRINIQLFNGYFDFIFKNVNHFNPIKEEFQSLKISNILKILILIDQIVLVFIR
jgi:hypothetical protein